MRFFNTTWFYCFLTTLKYCFQWNSLSLIKAGRTNFIKLNVYQVQESYQLFSKAINKLIQSIPVHLVVKVWIASIVLTLRSFKLPFEGLTIQTPSSVTTGYNDPAVTLSFLGAQWTLKIVETYALLRLELIPLKNFLLISSLGIY